jgi:four helix bundle protein
MTNWTTLPHEKLVAYQVAKELLAEVQRAEISDSRLRDQAMRAAMSACLNIAEAAGRQSAADQKRVFAIARGEASEAAAALDIAATARFYSVDSARIGGALARRAYALLTGLIRR